MKARWLVVVALVVSTSTSAFADDDWYALAPKGQHFSLKFPTAPTSQSRDITTDYGSMKLTAYSARLPFGADTQYVFSFADRPAKAPKAKTSELFELSEAPLAKQFKIFSRKDGKYRGYVMRDLEALSTVERDVKARIRFVIVGARMYMLMVVLDSSGGTHDPDVETFLASLKI